MEVFPCKICKECCREEFITIEKNIDGTEIEFIDLCISCFNQAADSLLKIRVFDNSLRRHICPYCFRSVKNDMDEVIVNNSNAYGNYCSIAYKNDNYVFLHPKCYEENIGL